MTEQKKQLLRRNLTAIAKECSAFEEQLNQTYMYQVYGCLISAVGTIIEAYLPNAKIGDLCKIIDPRSDTELFAEVMSLRDSKVRLLPFGSIEQIAQDFKIIRVNSGFNISVGDFLLNRVVNGFGDVIGIINEKLKVIDKPLLTIKKPIQHLAPDPFDRPLISEPIITGVKAIDLFNTCGLGQRVGIFAGPGIGKTTLMGMIIRNAKVDVVVVALIGERGREVREFIELELKDTTSERCVLAVTTSDHSAVEQLKCAYTAQTIAEYFRDQGKHVLLFMDSVTRFARAGREVGLSSGEPITRGGYPPSVFLSFPKLMERAGTTRTGSVTAFYTILMEGDKISDDPIADEVKSILDGHIVLSPKLAEKGQFPAIDILKSLSRIADRIINSKHLKAARHIKLLLSKYDELEFLIRVGEYKPGQDKLADESIEKHDVIINLLKQDRQDDVNFNAAINDMIRIVN